MRLLSLELTAFGPYAGTELIPLEDLTASGLFLLEGPTGAGKSTILDAITFALYGSTSSAGSSEDRLHSHFADPGLTPSVTLDFSVGDQRLRIHRVPAHRRPKKRGDGFTDEPTSVRLERRTAEDGWQHLEHNAAEIGSIIRTAIGLSREQFTQVVLLPQGEFATFLKADSDARKTLLTSIFRTGLFDRVTRELEERRRVANARRADALTAVGNAVAVALEAAGVQGEDADAVRGLLQTERAAALDRLTTTLGATAARAAHDRDEAAVAHASALATRDRAEQQYELLTALSDARSALVEHDRTRPQHLERTTELAAARAAEPVSTLLGELARADDRARLADAHLSGPAADLALHPDDLRSGSAAEQRALGAAAGELAATLDRLVVLESAVAGRRASLADGRSALLRDEEALRGLRQERTELPAQVGAAEQDLADTRALAERQASATEDARALATRLGAARDLAALAARLGAAHEAWRHADERFRDADRRHLELLRRHLAGVAAALAADLAAGDACPVCGSTEHQQLAVVGPETATADQVDAADVVARQERSATETARADVEVLEREQVRLTALAGDADVEGLETATAAALAEVARAEAAAARLGAETDHVRALRARRDSLEQEISAASSAVIRLRERLETDGAALDRDESELAEARGAHPTVALRRTSLRRETIARTAAADALDALAQATAAADRLRGRAERAARDAGFDDIAGARPAVRAPDEVAALESALTAWESRSVELRTRATDARFDGLDPENLAAVAEELRRADEDLVGHEQRRLTTASAADDAARRVARFADCLVDVRSAQDEHAAIVTATEPVVRLASLANGTRGSLPMPLTAYVLRRWFQQVVLAANHRLSTMSRGRYELERVDEAAKGEKRTGLSLKVIDRHTGESRSPKSLSGGETFYTSLALALGLADVVRAEAGGVELDTLFIDEGFGTLDADTLEQVMTVIDELRNGGRVVGIVSHVADLKDQIPERLEIRRLPDGSSTTTVVA